MPIILLFILILNIVSIVLMYYSLGSLEKKEKLLYIVVGTAAMYILTSIVYWFSTRGIEVTEVSERGKELITFLFVPINGIIILPLLARSYNKFKYGSLDKSVFLKRSTVLGVILLIVLIIECIYFKNIQQQVINMLNEQENSVHQQEQVTLNDVLNQTTNEMTNQIDTMIVNDTTNVITNNVQNQNTQITTNSINNVVENDTKN